MFDVHCTACGLRRLVFPNQVLGMASDEHGIHVAYRCWCGATGVWTTGRAEQQPVLATAS